MDISSLPYFIQTRIFLDCDPATILNLIQCCRFLRQFLTAKQFLDAYCQQIFGFEYCDLPELSPWHIAFVNSQQLLFQQCPILGTDNADRPWIKIYMHRFRIMRTEVHFDDAIREWEWPGIVENLVFDYGDIKPTIAKSNEPGPVGRILAKIYAVYPSIFDFPFSQNSLSWRCRLAWYPVKVPGRLPDLDSDSRYFNRFLTEHDNTELIAVLEICEPRDRGGHCGSAPLCFAFYNDESWFVGNCRPPCDPRSSLFCEERISSTASFDDIRRLTHRVVVERFLELSFSDRGSYCYVQPWPKWLLPDETVILAPNKLLAFQKECVLKLESMILSSASDLANDLVAFNSKMHYRRVRTCLDEMYSCMSLDHDVSCGGRRPSRIFRILLARALRRAVNSEFLPEVQQFFSDSISVAPPAKWERQYFYTVFGTLQQACSHRAHPELWPVSILMKAVEDLPRFSQELKQQVIDFMSNRFFKAECDKNGLGHVLRMFENM